MNLYVSLSEILVFNLQPLSRFVDPVFDHSTVTLFARFLGLSMSLSSATAVPVCKNLEHHEAREDLDKGGCLWQGDKQIDDIVQLLIPFASECDHRRPRALISLILETITP